MPQVRPAVPEEADALTALARRAKASWGYPAHWLDAWDAELTISAEYIRRHTVLVVRDGQRLVGCAALERDGASAELAHVWIEPDAHGRGLGRALVQAALREAFVRGCDSVLVVSDPNAAGFYERLGGVAVGSRDGSLDGVTRRLPVFRLATLPS